MVMECTDNALLTQLSVTQSLQCFYSLYNYSRKFLLQRKHIVLVFYNKQTTNKFEEPFSGYLLYYYNNNNFSCASTLFSEGSFSIFCNVYSFYGNININVVIIIVLGNYSTSEHII